jgi:hypothetical protein
MLWREGRTPKRGQQWNVMCQFYALPRLREWVRHGISSISVPYMYIAMHTPEDWILARTWYL